MHTEANKEAFKTAYYEFRNGANAFFKNPLYPDFLYSDGVRALAHAGCYWLLGILCTELPGEFKKRSGEYLCVVTITVKDNVANIVGQWSDDDETPWTKQIGFTDLPEGEWKLFVSDNGELQLTCILPSEY